jgi:hypothetical protein
MNVQKTQKQIYDAARYQLKSAEYKERSRIQRKEKKAKIASYMREYALNNQERLRAYKKEYYKKNKATINSRNLQRIRENIEVKLASYLRRRLLKALKNNYKKGSAVTLLGCSILQLREHLKNKFKPGMSWENYGKWHIDHIKPLSSFNLLDEKELSAACHYTNLQPLWAVENWKKGAKCLKD